MGSHTYIPALKSGIDPLAFRMKNLADEGMINVLKAAAAKFGQEFTKGPGGRGFGITCTNYLNAFVATIMHVSVNKTTGR